MTWYCWATQVIMVISLTARHLTFGGTENNRPVGEGESAAVLARSFVHRGINDEVYCQRIM